MTKKERITIYVTKEEQELLWKLAGPRKTIPRLIIEILDEKFGKDWVKLKTQLNAKAR